MKEWLIKMILQWLTIRNIEGTYPKYWNLKKFHDLKKLKFKALIKWKETSIILIVSWWSIKNMKAFFKENFKLFIDMTISGMKNI